MLGIIDLDESILKRFSSMSESLLQFISYSAEPIRDNLSNLHLKEKVVSYINESDTKGKY